MGGAVFILSLSLYPYAYLFAKVAFRTLGQKYDELGTLSGLTEWKKLTHIMLPLSKPWIVAGGIIIALEVLADFGAMSILNVPTFTTEIYKAWFGYFAFAKALWLSLVLAIISGTLMWAESKIAKKDTDVSDLTRNTKQALSNRHRLVIGLFYTIIIGLSVGIPIIQLVVWLIQEGYTSSTIINPLINSVVLSVSMAVIITLIATGLIIAQTLNRSQLKEKCLQILSIGYGLPGPIIAVLVYTMLSKWSVLISTIVVTMCALAFRFFSVSLRQLQTGIKRVSPCIHDIFKLTDISQIKKIKRIYIPLLKSSIGIGFLMIIIEVIKEMPITLMTRPVGWDTLSVKVFEYTSEGLWELAAGPACIILLVSCIPVIILEKRT